MSTSDDVLRELNGRVLQLTLNRPDKHNPLSRSVLASLRQHFLDAADIEDLACVLLTGAGERYFAAGGDLRDLATVRSAAETETMAEQARLALDAVRTCPVPVIAVLRGDAIGGGAELAVACDLRIMRDSARIGFIQGRLQITSAWGGGPDLVNLVGPARALRMMMRTELVSAPTALDWGLADAIASNTELDAAVQDFIKPLLRLSSRVIRGGKAQTLAARQGRPYNERRDIERQALITTWTHDDHWDAVAPFLTAGDTKQ